MSSVKDILAKADDEQVLMMEERVQVTDFYDNVIGDGSKKDTHIWKDIEDGLLHRAFSVFLFTQDGKLILQQRSACKITFPLVWANTCCSHPLYTSSELLEDDAAGVKNAARRKLQQELGIVPDDVPFDSFSYITRVHYAGASDSENGESPIWGEHEIDWIMLCRPSADPTINFNVNEVNATRAFTPDELREWIDTLDERGDKVSPWFITMERSGLLYRWWNAVLSNNIPSVYEHDRIYRQNELELLASARRSGELPLTSLSDLPDQLNILVSKYGLPALPKALESSKRNTHKMGVYGPKNVPKFPCEHLKCSAVTGHQNSIEENFYLNQKATQSSNIDSKQNLSGSSEVQSAPSSDRNVRKAERNREVSSKTNFVTVTANGPISPPSSVSTTARSAEKNEHMTHPLSYPYKTTSKVSLLVPHPDQPLHLPTPLEARMELQKKKQGAYGRIPTHSPSLLPSLLRSDEVIATFSFLLNRRRYKGADAAQRVNNPSFPFNRALAPESVVFCNDILGHVSRSFAGVIAALSPELRASITIFYLALRALDTVEDDMACFPDPAEKVHYLGVFAKLLDTNNIVDALDSKGVNHFIRTFTQKASDHNNSPRTKSNMKIFGVGDGHERRLMEGLHHVVDALATLSLPTQAVILDITQRMAQGMAAFANRSLNRGTDTIAEYNLYCHIVAGLVGEGLTQLFVLSGDTTEDSLSPSGLKLADDMGLFLQKTNIIRDYLEDAVEGRAFWPVEIYALYAQNSDPARADLRDFACDINPSFKFPPVEGASKHAYEAGATPQAQAHRRDQALKCLNHMVANALQLVPSVLTYLRNLSDSGCRVETFRFCATPQLMSLATLEAVVNNTDVFTGVVKIAKPRALSLLRNAVSMEEVSARALALARSIVELVPPQHAAQRQMAMRALHDIEHVATPILKASKAKAGLGIWSPVVRALTHPQHSQKMSLGALGTLAVLLYALAVRQRDPDGEVDVSEGLLPRVSDSWDVLLLVLIVALIGYLLAWAGVPVANAVALDSPPSVTTSNLTKTTQHSPARPQKKIVHA